MFLLIAIALFVEIAIASFYAHAGHGPIVGDIRVAEYEQRDGELSSLYSLRRVTENDIGMWNTVDTSIFFFVDVNGDSDAWYEDVSLRLVASGKKRKKQVESVSLGVFDQKGNYHIPFVVHGPFCEPLVIRVELIKKGKVISQGGGELPFACGE